MNDKASALLANVPRDRPIQAMAMRQGAKEIERLTARCDALVALIREVRTEDVDEWNMGIGWHERARTLVTPTADK